MFWKKKQNAIDKTLQRIEMILLWVAENEPVGSYKELLASGIDESELKRELIRLNNADFITGKPLGAFGMREFFDMGEINLTYSGIEEIRRIWKNKGLVKGMTINFGLIQFHLGGMQ